MNTKGRKHKQRFKSERKWAPKNDFNKRTNIRKIFDDDDNEFEEEIEPFVNKFAKNFIVKHGVKWFKQLPKQEYEKSKQSPDEVSAKRTEAQRLMDEDTQMYNKFKNNERDKDYMWLKKILRSGTLQDKISAHTLLLQDSAVHNLFSVEVLVKMVTTKGKRECLMAMSTLQDLFVSELLIEDKKLTLFSEQPLTGIDKLSNGNEARQKQILILWLFEDKLKSLYKQFIANLDAVTHDTVERTKMKAVTVMYNLLKNNPEQEQFLLEHLVNKIGDPIPKVGSHVCYLLGQLLCFHSVMKGIVIQEVERLLFRSNVAERAKYYCLCFLNQVILNVEDFEVANRLIMMYFGQFKACIKTGEVNTKIMSALLTGVGRAYPYSRLKEDVLMEQLDSMYRLVHMVGFNISVQAMMLIFQMLDAKDAISDRFYSALYRKLLDPALACSNRQATVLNLVYRALKKDVAIVRIKAFIKRLIQIALYQAPNLQCGILILISELTRNHPTVLETKILKFEDDSDSEEHFCDVSEQEDNEDETAKTTAKTIPECNDKPTGPSWVHKPQWMKKKKSGYQFNDRNPLHAGAEFSEMWELAYLRKCFHPSVSLFAHQVCKQKVIAYSGDPLLDFTTARFLDRFVYRNPKKPTESLGSSAQKHVFGPRKARCAKKNYKPITSHEYIQQNVDKVPADELFIYQYLKQHAANKKKDSDVESVCSGDFERFLDEIHPDDEGKDSLNFMKELGLHKQKQKKKGKKKQDSDDDAMSYENESADEIDFDNDEEFQQAFESCEDDDLEDADFAAEDFVPAKKKAKKMNKMDGDIFASVDEFSTLLEENAGSKIDTVTTEAFVNKDKSGPKQLAWEAQRDKFVRGVDWKSKKKKFGRNRKFKRH